MNGTSLNTRQIESLIMPGDGFKMGGNNLPSILFKILVLSAVSSLLILEVITSWIWKPRRVLAMIFRIMRRHVIMPLRCVCIKQEREPEDFVSPIFTIAEYKTTYQSFLQPIDLNVLAAADVKPPEFVVQAGRPKIRRERRKRFDLSNPRVTFLLVLQVVDPKLLLSLNLVTTKMKLIKRMTMTMTLMTIIATAIMTARATI